jgi:hypothetical protein
MKNPGRLYLSICPCGTLLYWFPHGGGIGAAVFKENIFFLSEPKKHRVPPAVALMNLKKVVAEFHQTRLDSQCHLQLQ